MMYQGIEITDNVVYEAQRIESNQKVYGIGLIKANEDVSYLIQSFETNDFVDDAPALAYYIAVKTQTVSIVKPDGLKNGFSKKLVKQYNDRTDLSLNMSDDLK